MTTLVHELGIEIAAVPIDTISAAVSGDWYTLKLYDHITIIIAQGAWAGGTPAVVLKQATDVSGSGSKALAFAKRWTQVAISGTGYTETAVTSDTFNLPNTANSINLLEIDSVDLDQAGGFDCLRVEIASPGANADLIAIFAVLSKPRFAQATMSDGKVD